MAFVYLHIRGPMGFRFRRTLKIAPGLRFNFGRRGVSASIGRRGASMTVGKHGTYANVGLPGSGISYRTRVTPPIDRTERIAQGRGGGVATFLIVAVLLGVLSLLLG